MFTRVWTSSAEHLFEAPLISVPTGTPGSDFFGCRGGSYGYVESILRGRLLQFVEDLNDSLHEPEFVSRKDVKVFLKSLESLIEFLHSQTENSVYLFSYDGTPSLSDLLRAFSEGNGADDWALEEMAKRGEKGRKALLTRLKKEKERSNILAAISMLLILFRDEQTVTSVKKFIDNQESEIGAEASLLLAAYIQVPNG